MGLGALLVVLEKLRSCVQQLCHGRDLSLVRAVNAEHLIKFCHPSPAMVAFPYKWKI
jgi:hypothetical protein